jgi:hypothetical protein
MPSVWLVSDSAGNERDGSEEYETGILNGLINSIKR